MPHVLYDRTNHQQPALNFYARDVEAIHLLVGPVIVDFNDLEFTGYKVVSTVAETAGDNKTITFEQAIGKTLSPGMLINFANGKSVLQVTQLTKSSATEAVGKLIGPAAGTLAVGDVGIINFGKPVGVVAAGTPVSRASDADPYTYGDPADDDFYLLPFDARPTQPDGTGWAERLKHGHEIYCSELPGWDDMSAALQTKIKSLYKDVVLPVNRW